MVALDKERFFGGGQLCHNSVLWGDSFLETHTHPLNFPPSSVQKWISNPSHSAYFHRPSLTPPQRPGPPPPLHHHLTPPPTAPLLAPPLCMATPSRSLRSPRASSRSAPQACASLPPE